MECLICFELCVFWDWYLKYAGSVIFSVGKVVPDLVPESSNYFACLKFFFKTL